MNTKALRQKILDLAIHGKLVPQDPNDEPASVLLERIKAEKERLIKEGKIKRSKRSKAACDKPHYPFELPKGWCWCKLYDIVEFIGGYAYKSNTYVSKSDYQVIRIGNVKNDFLNLENLPVFVPETIGNQTDKYRIYENDILFTMTGTKGKRDYFFTTVVIKQEKILLLNQRVGCLRSFSTELNMNYLSMLLKCKYILDSIFSTETGNVSQGNIGSENTLNLFVALPPYVEQQRIVKKVNSFFDLLNVMEERKRNLQDCIHDIKVKILDLAIHGKLVPQDPNDEPATELLKRINPKAEITCDNPQYGMLPKGWCGCSFSDIFEITMGQSPTGCSINHQHGVEFHQGKISFGDKYLMQSDTFTDEPTKLAEPNSLLLCVRAPVGVVNITQRKICIGRGLCSLKTNAAILLDYAYHALTTYQSTFESQSTGSTFKAISGNIIRNERFALPPINEQHRIVAKIEELFSQLDSIASSL